MKISSFIQKEFLCVKIRDKNLYGDNELTLGEALALHEN